jgi:8-oxo-dGTP pyrophosphatase MutT (NUDIX family)
MNYLEKPENFESEFDIVGILIHYKKSFLLLKRALHKPQGGTWGAPGGKKEKGESIIDAIIRETFEETGIKLDLQKLMYCKPFYVCHEGRNFTYHLYSYEVKEKPEIILEKGGHDMSDWFTKDGALQIELIHDMAFCIEDFVNSLV